MTEYISEANYSAEMSQKVEPNWHSGTIGYFDGFDDSRLRYGHFGCNSPQKTIIIASGQSEYMERYKELVYDFNMRSYDVFIYDHRGQGGSDRVEGIQNSTHVRDFTDYVKDLEIFVRDVVSEKAHGKPYLFAHSMGGAVAAGYLARNPNTVSRAILHAPMLGIIPPILTDTISKNVAKILGQIPIIKNLRAPGARKIPGPKSYLSLSLTHSEARFKYNYDFAANRPDMRIDVAAATFRLGAEAYKFLDHLFEAERIESIQTPILILQAPDDNLVSNQAQELFCERANNCTLTKITNGSEKVFHEAHFEVDPVRRTALDRCFQFLDS